MKHVSTQTTKMVDVAMATVNAAETEEVMGVGSGSGDDSEPSPDPEVQVRYPIRVLIEKLNQEILYIHACRGI